MRTAGDIAREATRVFRLTVGWVRLDGPVDDGHGPDGHAWLWLGNGYGVSLITRPDDDLPELCALKRHASSGKTAHVAVPLEGGWSTDPVGVRRECDAQNVINILTEMIKWETA